MLDKKCGTMPYVSPEVLVKPYLAQPADIWSCGIILVTMLAGGKHFLFFLLCFAFALPPTWP
jgi:serine/threonine protein kinase